jgi:branched-subunit amino acid transport protein AzlD
MYLNILINTVPFLTFYEKNKTRFINSYEIYAIEWYSVVFVSLIITCFNDSSIMEVITVL